MAKAVIEIKEKEMILTLNEKTFKAGSTGFHGFGKLEVADGEKYQINIIATLIGSKPVDKD